MAIPPQSRFVVVVHPYFIEAHGEVMNEERQHEVVIRGKERHDFGDGLRSTETKLSPLLYLIN